MGVRVAAVAFGDDRILPAGALAARLVEDDEASIRRDLDPQPLVLDGIVGGTHQGAWHLLDRKHPEPPRSHEGRRALEVDNGLPRPRERVPDHRGGAAAGEPREQGTLERGAVCAYR